MNKYSYRPTQMNIDHFCAKYGFREITTPRMEGRRFTNDKIVIGWTDRWLIYHNVKKKNGEKFTGSGGIFNEAPIYHFFFEDDRKMKKYQREYQLFHNQNHKIPFSKRRTDKFEFMLSYLNQFPRKGMFHE